MGKAKALNIECNISTYCQYWVAIECNTLAIWTNKQRARLVTIRHEFKPEKLPFLFASIISKPNMAVARKY